MEAAGSRALQTPSFRGRRARDTPFPHPWAGPPRRHGQTTPCSEYTEALQVHDGGRYQYLQLGLHTADVSGVAHSMVYEFRDLVLNSGPHTILGLPDICLLLRSQRPVRNFVRPDDHRPTMFLSGRAVRPQGTVSACCGHESESDQISAPLDHRPTAAARRALASPGFQIKLEIVLGVQASVVRHLHRCHQRGSTCLHGRTHRRSPILLHRALRSSVRVSCTDPAPNTAVESTNSSIFRANTFCSHAQRSVQMNAAPDCSWAIRRARNRHMVVASGPPSWIPRPSAYFHRRSYRQRCSVSMSGVLS